jgi:PAS domain S-box-containing protein
MKSIVATLEEKILGAQQRLDGLRQTVSGADVDSQHLLPSALEELSSALEELHASADELEARNEELAHAHDAVERERRRYLELFEFAPDAYLVTDTLGTIGEANAAAATLLHRRQYFLVGKPLAIFVAPPTHPDFYETLNNLQRGVADRSEDREIHLLLHDGAALDVAVSASAVRDRSGQITGIRWLLRDITERKRIAALRAERASLSAFSSAVGLALTETGTVEAALQRCAAAMVEHLGAALARIWTMNDAAQVLELQASAGMYTHIDGRHSRIPLGELKIGRIAQQRQPHLTNSVVGDPHIHDQDWVQREHLVAFAGYPLVLAENTVVGVIAMFARQPIGDETLIALAAVAREIALGIEHKHTEQRLAGALQEIEHIMETVPDIIYTLDAEARLIRWNRKMETATGLSPQELRGRPATNFFPDDQRAVISAAIQLALATGYSEAEVELLGPGGTAVP